MTHGTTVNTRVGGTGSSGVAEVEVSWMRAPKEGEVPLLQQ